MELASKELSELAKEKGFDWECTEVYSPTIYKLKYYEGDGSGVVTNLQIEEEKEFLKYNCTAPTLSQLQKWLRERHQKIVLLQTYYDEYHYEIYAPVEKYGVIIIFESDDCVKTYEEALEKGLYHALNLVE